MRPMRELRGLLWVTLVAVVVGIATFAVVRANPHWFRQADLGRSPSLSVAGLLQVDPEMILYREEPPLPVPLVDLQALATGPDRQILVAGDHAIQELQPDGTLARKIALGSAARCLTVADRELPQAGTIYIGSENCVETVLPGETVARPWLQLDPGALVTSIAVGREHVYLADAGHRLVLRCDLQGRVESQLGAREATRERTQFIVPSRHFEAVLDAEGLLHVANPGARRIETFTPDGQLESFWGSAGADLAGFFGCCNPLHVALLPGGDVVTSEKGLPRIKLYGADGTFRGVVAGPAQLGVSELELAGDLQESPLVFDVAVDREGRVLVLDARRRAVRVFVSKAVPSGAVP